MRNVLILDNGTIALYRFRKEVVAALIAAGWRVTVSAPNDGFLDKLLELGITYIDTSVDRKGTSPVRDYYLLRKYRRLMCDIKPDVVLTYTIKPNIYGNLTAKGLNIPVISMVTGLGEAFIYDNSISRLVKVLYRLAFRKTSRILFLNQDDMEIMREAGLLSGQERLLISGEGVDINEFPVIEYPDTDTVSFLYMGRIIRPKGIGQLIEASRRLQAERPGAFTVTLIGYHEGDMSGEVERAERAGIIRYAGFQKDVKPFVTSAHCVVLPSYYKEGLPVSLLEAAASARPIIATDIGGCREIVGNGVNGLLCKPRDTDSLYECMKRFLDLTNDRRMEMGKNSRNKVEAEFNRAYVVDMMLKMIDAVSRKDK